MSYTLSCRFVSICVILVNVNVFGAVPSQIELSVKQDEIRVGEPLIMELRMIWDEPLMAQDSNQPLNSVHHSASVFIRSVVNKDKIYKYPLLSPLFLRIDGADGRCYKGTFVILYDHGRKSLCFGDPGTYELEVRAWTKTSNISKVKVEPASQVEAKAISLLSDPNCYALLLDFYGDEGDKEALLKRVKLVADECEESTLGKWCASLIGRGKFQEFMRGKKKSAAALRGLHEQGKLQEESLAEAIRYLELGSKLPNEIQVRESALFDLVRAEYIRGKDDRVTSLMEELENHYPDGRFGKRVPAMRSELERLKVEEPYDASEANATEENGLRRGHILGILGGAGAVALLIAGLVVLGKKRGK